MQLIIQDRIYIGRRELVNHCIVTVSGSYDGLAWRVGTCTGSRTTTGLPNSTQYVQYNNNNDQYIRISTAGKE